MQPTVIHHSADYDGLFCREIARKFLPEAKLIGWDFADPPLALPFGRVFVLDLPIDRTFGFDFTGPKALPEGFNQQNFVWIDHHKSSIETHPADIPGCRMDGVAACRLAWQWFIAQAIMPAKEMFVERKVSEPLAVQLAGEYDIWDHRDPRAVPLQFGLDSVKELDWDALLTGEGWHYTEDLVENGRAAQNVIAKRDASMIAHRSFEVEFEGLKFLCLNIARCNSQTFISGVKPEHDGVMGFYWNGKHWNFSLYGVPGKPAVDLSRIAVKYGGGGHKQACGFRADTLPWA